MANRLHLSNPVVSRCGCVTIYVEHDRPERPTSQARPKFGDIDWNCASVPVSRLAELAAHLAACTES